MPPALLIGPTGGAGACPVCGGTTCNGGPPTNHLSTYPFLPGGREPVPGTDGREFVIAPHAVHDPALERNVYGAGDRVPMADAIRYGLVDGPEPAEPEGPKRGGRRAKRRPAEDRAHHGPDETTAGGRGGEDRDGSVR